MENGFLPHPLCSANSEILILFAFSDNFSAENSNRPIVCGVKTPATPAFRMYALDDTKKFHLVKDHPYPLFMKPPLYSTTPSYPMAFCLLNQGVEQTRKMWLSEVEFPWAGKSWLYQRFMFWIKNINIQRIVLSKKGGKSCKYCCLKILTFETKNSFVKKRRENLANIVV